MKVGDIHWVQLQGAGGRSQMGRRPAIIIQDDMYGGSLPTLLVVPLTSAQMALRFPGTVEIKSTPETGLRTDSVALVFQCIAIDRRQVLEVIGSANDEDCRNVLLELARLTGQFTVKHLHVSL